MMNKTEFLALIKEYGKGAPIDIDKIKGEKEIFGVWRYAESASVEGDNIEYGTSDKTYIIGISGLDKHNPPIGNVIFFNFKTNMMPNVLPEEILVSSAHQLPFIQEPPPIPTECVGLGFTEVVRCEQVGDYFYAAGWTTSFGIGADVYPYVMPLYWEADPNEVDVRGKFGSHGGCPTCTMTLVHIRRYIEVVKDCPAYNLLSGETTCMERDLWKCENGEMVKIEENSPECKEVEPENGNGPACPIACVCMGTPLIDQLGPIREFRDKYLSKWFVKYYYGWFGQKMVPWLEKHSKARKMGRFLVKGMLWRTTK